MNINLHYNETSLSSQAYSELLHFLDKLIDQEKARILVPAYDQKPGFWFGGGNMVEDDGGNLWLVGRYRNYGDSRTGLEAGTRGLELAIFRSSDDGETFKKVKSWSKADLNAGLGDVLSIEGTALHRMPDGRWELFLSTERARSYPDAIAEFQKPGTGIWSIQRLVADTPTAFDPAELERLLWTDTVYPDLHIKDPVVFDEPDGSTVLMFCTSPFTWSASNTGMCIRHKGAEQFSSPRWQIVQRGATWDVAAARITGTLLLDAFSFDGALPLGRVYFYDGAESMRQLDENTRAVQRPRGFSCEEIGGALYAPRGVYTDFQRLAPLQPLFVSPYGTGSSRYVDILRTEQGIWTTWQQSQPTGDQPLVGHFVTASG